MPTTSAAYMREYRARRKAADDIHETALIGAAISADLVRAEDRIRELEAEVAHLKRELAARASGLPITVVRAATALDEPQWVPEYRPVPKPGKRK